MRKGILIAIGGAIGGLVFLTGCGHQQYNIPVQPKWQGAAYHIAFDTQAAKPNPTGVTIPDIKYTANPDALETRACLVVRVDDAGAATSRMTTNQMVMGAVDIHGAAGSLPADYMEAADKGLSGLLGAYGVKGKVKISVLLARSSISSQPGESQIEEFRLSDWLPTEVAVGAPHRIR